jgi:hypothetical protein
MKTRIGEFTLPGIMHLAVLATIIVAVIIAFSVDPGRADPVMPGALPAGIAPQVLEANGATLTVVKKALGSGDKFSFTSQTLSPTAFDLFAAMMDGPSALVSAGGYHSCGLKPGGAVDCWGTNGFGQADDGIGPFVQVSAGEEHTCALTWKNAIDCWGYNGRQTVDEPGPFTQVSAGRLHTCALTPSGKVECWGNNVYGESNPPNETFSQISAGTSHTCALRLSGLADCWGNNDYGQAGDQLGPYTQISAGGDHNCALTPAGAVECWGDNQYGQAGNKTGPYTQVSAGGFNTCALTQAGAIECWGRNDHGQSTPPNGTFVQVSAGRYHACALAPSGSVDCWGLNTAGQADDQAGIFQAPWTQVFTNLAPGSYDVTESVPFPWKQTSATCDNGDQPDQITLADGDDVTCIFENTKLPTLTVIKNTIGGNGTFDFTSQTLSPNTFSLITVNQTANRVFELPGPGIYDLAETNLPQSWSLYSATCNNGDTPDSIQINPHQDVTCNFGNILAKGLLYFPLITNSLPTP